MLMPKCDLCGQPATIHETAIEGGAVVTRYHCQEHGESVRQAINLDLGASSLWEAEEYFRNLTNAEREEMAMLHRITRHGT